MGKDTDIRNTHIDLGDRVSCGDVFSVGSVDPKDIDMTVDGSHRRWLASLKSDLEFLLDNDKHVIIKIHRSRVETIVKNLSRILQEGNTSNL